MWDWEVGTQHWGCGMGAFWIGIGRSMENWEIGIGIGIGIRDSGWVYWKLGMRVLENWNGVLERGMMDGVRDLLWDIGRLGFRIGEWMLGDRGGIRDWVWGVGLGMAWVWIVHRYWG